MKLADLRIHVLHALLFVFLNVAIGTDGEALECFWFCEAFDEHSLCDVKEEDGANKQKYGCVKRLMDAIYYGETR